MYNQNNQSTWEEIKNLLAQLPPSINSIDKETRRKQVNKIQSILNNEKLPGLEKNELMHLNFILSEKNYQIIQDANGKYILRDRDNAHEATYSERFTHFLQATNDKTKCTEALSGFVTSLVDLDFFSNLVNKDGIRLIDIGAGDGSTALPIMNALNQKKQCKIYCC